MFNISTMWTTFWTCSTKTTHRTTVKVPVNDPQVQYLQCEQDNKILPGTSCCSKFFCCTAPWQSLAYIECFMCTLVPWTCTCWLSSLKFCTLKCHLLGKSHMHAWWHNCSLSPKTTSAKFYIWQNWHNVPGANQQNSANMPGFVNNNPVVWKGTSNNPRSLLS